MVPYGGAKSQAQAQYLDRVAQINKKHKLEQSRKQQLDSKLKEKEQQMEQIRQQLIQKGVPESELPSLPSQEQAQQPAQKAHTPQHSQQQAARERRIGRGRLDSHGHVLLQSQSRSHLEQSAPAPSTHGSVPTEASPRETQSRSQQEEEQRNIHHTKRTDEEDGVAQQPAIAPQPPQESTVPTEEAQHNQLDGTEAPSKKQGCDVSAEDSMHQSGGPHAHCKASDAHESAQLPSKTKRERARSTSAENDRCYEAGVKKRKIATSKKQNKRKSKDNSNGEKEQGRVHRNSHDAKVSENKDANDDERDDDNLHEIATLAEGANPDELVQSALNAPIE